MINEILFMNGYGYYVWSAFVFTFTSFAVLYAIIKIQYNKEMKKFVAKFGALDTKRASSAKSQDIIKEILSNTSNI